MVAEIQSTRPGAAPTSCSSKQSEVEMMLHASTVCECGSGFDANVPAARGHGNSATGDLHLTHRTAGGRKIPLLQLLGADCQWPSLYEPRLVALSAREFGFIGLERHGDAWVLQQWDGTCCKLRLYDLQLAATGATNP